MPVLAAHVCLTRSLLTLMAVAVIYWAVEIWLEIRSPLHVTLRYGISRAYTEINLCIIPTSSRALPLHPHRLSSLFPRGAGPHLHLSKSILHERWRRPDYIDNFIQLEEAASVLL